MGIYGIIDFGDRVALGAHLKARRKALGLTQVDVAQQLGVSYSTIQRLEAHGPKRVDVLLAVLEVLGLKLQIEEKTEEKTDA